MSVPFWVKDTQSEVLIAYFGGYLSAERVSDLRETIIEELEKYFGIDVCKEACTDDPDNDTPEKIEECFRKCIESAFGGGGIDTSECEQACEDDPDNDTQEKIDACKSACKYLPLMAGEAAKLVGDLYSDEGAFFTKEVSAKNFITTGSDDTEGGGGVGATVESLEFSVNGQEVTLTLTQAGGGQEEFTPSFTLPDYDLTGYATEDWVDNQGFLTLADVEDFVKVDDPSVIWTGDHIFEKDVTSTNFITTGSDDGSAGSGGSGALLRDIIPTLTVGGIKKGDPTITEDLPITDVFEKLLSPYVAPTLTSIALSKNSTYEVGLEVDVNSATVIWVNDIPYGNPPTSARITGVGFNVDVTLSGTSQTVTSDGTMSVRTTPGYLRWSFIGNDKDGNSIGSRNKDLYWRYRYSFGASTSVPSTDAEATALIGGLSSVLDTNRANEFGCPAESDLDGYYTYISYPKTFGLLTAITQDGALPVLSAFEMIGTFKYTNPHGVQVDYYIYKSKSDRAFGDGVKLKMA